VLVGIGVEVTFETVSAAFLLRSLYPSLKVRVVNVTDLMILAPETTHPHALSREKFAELFTRDRPVLFNYHGYPTELQGLLFGRDGESGVSGIGRMRVNGYREEGSTTTPFDMMLVNGVSRFDLAEGALRAVAERNEEVKKGLEELVGEVKRRVAEVQKFIREHGKGECIRPVW
jgi:xylulose-5-phosphate/fructose-6-phosphate phosphoketolase